MEILYKMKSDNQHLLEYRKTQDLIILYIYENILIAEHINIYMVCYEKIRRPSIYLCIFMDESRYCSTYIIKLVH